MRRFLGEADAKDLQGPSSLSMVRSRATNRATTTDSAYTTFELKGHGVKFDYPKGWGLVEEQRKIHMHHPDNRAISLNLIIGVVPHNTKLDDLSAQALETYGLPLALCGCLFFFPSLDC